MRNEANWFHHCKVLRCWRIFLRFVTVDIYRDKESLHFESRGRIVRRNCRCRFRCIINQDYRAACVRLEAWKKFSWRISNADCAGVMHVSRLEHFNLEISQKFADCTKYFKILKTRNWFNFRMNRIKFDTDVTLYFEGFEIEAKN